MVTQTAGDMVLRDVGDFVAEHRRELRFGLSEKDEPAVDADEAAGKSKSVDRRIGHREELEVERCAGDGGDQPIAKLVQVAADLWIVEIAPAAADLAHHALTELAFLDAGKQRLRRIAELRKTRRRLLERLGRISGRRRIRDRLGSTEHRKILRRILRHRDGRQCKRRADPRDHGGREPAANGEGRFGHGAMIILPRRKFWTRGRADTQGRASAMAGERAHFTHFDAAGQARMVDVSAKEITRRIARAGGRIAMRAETLAMIRAGQAGKGDVLGVARIAAIQAAKRTAELIPLAHPLPLTSIAVEFALDEPASAVAIEVVAETLDRTGVEMEALTAAAVGLLTIYDMCKAVDRGMTMDGIHLVEKRGGKSGSYGAP